MKSKIFDINDIIVIISKMIEDRKNEELYGIEDDILDIPQYISDKIDMLEEDDCEELFSIIDDIVEEVYKLKTGELHELNLIHKEVMILSEEKLYKYINTYSK